MTDPVITDACQIDRDWLCRVLPAPIVAFEAEEPAANTWSRSTRIRVTYDHDDPALPTRLFLKICTDATLGPSEVHYYTRDYVDLADPPIPRCYDAQYATSPRRYHILMEDHSETHTHSFDTPRTEAYGGAVAEALARLHAHWWATGARGAARLALPGDDPLDRHIEHIRPGLEPMLQHAADEIQRSERDTLHALFTKHPPLMRRRATRREGFTLVHGGPRQRPLPQGRPSPRLPHRPPAL